MSVQLDWEIDQEDTPLTNISSSIGPGRRGCRRWWRLFAFVALVAVIGLGFLRYKLEQKQREVEDALRANVELELTALINGDQELFLNLQDPDNRRWRRDQERAFEQYHQQIPHAPWDDAPPALAYTGQVSTVRVEGSEGWALVQVALGERTWLETWLYRWTEVDGWRHIRLDEEWLGQEETYSTAHFYFSFPERDRDIVVALAREMESWHDILVPLYPNTPLMTIEFAYRDSKDPQWSSRRSYTLLAPSPHQGGLGSHKTPSSKLRQQMAGYLAEVLIWRQSGLRPNQKLPVEVDALRHELKDWTISRLAQEAPGSDDWTSAPTPLLDTLVAHQGTQVLPALAEGLRNSATLDQALAAAGLAPPDLATRFGFLLGAQIRAFYGFDVEGYQALLDPEADIEWRQRYSSLLRWQSENPNIPALATAPSSLWVKSVTLHDGVAWVETETTSSDDVVYYQVHFFRLVGDRWFLTAPDPAYLGKRRTLRTENLVFEYFERDARWFEGPFSAELQAVLSQVAADLGLETDGLIITITSEYQGESDGQVYGDVNLISLGSPSITGWPIDHLDDQVFQISFSLMAALYQNTLQEDPQNPYPYPSTLVSAFLWEWERLFPQRINWTAWLGFDIHRAPTLSLEELWASHIFETTGETDFEQVWINYNALLKFLAETYGPEIVPALLDNLRQTDNLDEWLRLSTGGGLDEIEPAWQAWVAARYGEP